MKVMKMPTAIQFWLARPMKSDRDSTPTEDSRYFSREEIILDMYFDFRFDFLSFDISAQFSHY